MCWTGEQPAGAGLENVAGRVRTAAHGCATQRPCHRHVGAAHVPQPSCQSPAKPWGSCGQAGLPSQGLPVTPCPSWGLPHTLQPIQISLPTTVQALGLIPGPLVVPSSSGATRLCSGLGHAHGCAALPAPGSPFCPGLSDPGTTSGSCSRSAPEGFRSGLPSFGEERTPLLHTSGDTIAPG